jgi:hypothetical protein
MKEGTRSIKTKKELKRRKNEEVKGRNEKVNR